MPFSGPGKSGEKEKKGGEKVLLRFAKVVKNWGFS